MFGDIEEEPLDEDGEVKFKSLAATLVKPRLARGAGGAGGGGGGGAGGRGKRKRGAGSNMDDIPMTEAEREAYLEQLQEADNKATQAYLDNYDQDQLMRPPTPTYTYQGLLHDPIGTSPVTIDSMGTWLSLKARGIRFEGYVTCDDQKCSSKNIFS